MESERGGAALELPSRWDGESQVPALEPGTPCHRPLPLRVTPEPSQEAAMRGYAIGAAMLAVYTERIGLRLAQEGDQFRAMTPAATGSKRRLVAK